MGLSLFLSLLGWSLLGEAKPVAAETSPRKQVVKPSEELGLKSKPARSTAKEESKPNAEAPEKPASKTRKTSGKSVVSARPAARLPRFYSQLDLAEDQRQKLLELQQRFAEQIAALREEMTKLQQERDGQLLSVLKPGQKRRLKELQAEVAPAKNQSQRD